MPDPTSPALPGTPYGEFLAEQEEIQRLKWLASEKEGHDIGFEFALNEWVQNHRAEWRTMRNKLQSHQPDSSGHSGLPW